MTTRRAPHVALLLVGVLAGGCSSGAKQPASSAGKAQTLAYQYTAFDQLDPQRVSDGAPIAGQNLLEGMVTPDAAGTGVVPATADTVRGVAQRPERVVGSELRPRPRRQRGLSGQPVQGRGQPPRGDVAGDDVDEAVDVGHGRAGVELGLLTLGQRGELRPLGGHASASTA